MADSRAQAHVRRSEELFGQLNLWLPTWRDICELVLPRKANLSLMHQPSRSQGRTNTERMLDSVAPHALELLAASMQGALTSESIRWFYFRLRGIPYGEDITIDRWLEKSGNTAYDELRQSNFSAEAHEFYTDLGSIGTSAMFIEKKDPKPGNPWQGLRFKTLPPASYAVAENEDGIVDTLYYKYRYTGRQATQKFGMENLPDEIRRHVLQGTDTERPFDFINAIFPRTDRWADAGAAKFSNGKPFASVHIYAGGAPQVVKDSGYEEFPFAVGRWTKSSDEVYGRSPAFTILAHLKTLNKLVELKLRALANKVYPPMKVRDQGVLGVVKLSPGGLTHVRDMDAVEPLFTDRGGIDSAMLNEKAMQEMVRQGFFTDQLQLQEGPQMTAFEVQVRYELMQRILGPTLGRLNVEFLNPVVTRVFRLLERGQRIDAPPAALVAKMKELGRGFDIEYEGPLQRAQRLGDVVTIQRFLQLVLPLAQMNPKSLDNIDMDAVVRVSARNTGVTPEIIRDKGEMDELRQANAEAEAKDKQMAQTMQSAQAMGQAAPALEAITAAAKGGILPQGGLSGQGAVTGGVGR